MHGVFLQSLNTFIYLHFIYNRFLNRSNIKNPYKSQQLNLSWRSTHLHCVIYICKPNCILSIFLYEILHFIYLFVCPFWVLSRIDTVLIIWQLFSLVEYDHSCPSMHYFRHERAPTCIVRKIPKSLAWFQLTAMTVFPLFAQWYTHTPSMVTILYRLFWMFCKVQIRQYVVCYWSTVRSFGYQRTTRVISLHELNVSILTIFLYVTPLSAVSYILTMARTVTRI